MPYVMRDKNNRVVGIFIGPPANGTKDEDREQLSIDHPEIINFLTQAGEDDKAKKLLDQYDTAIPRILEDLIDILIRNQLIRFSEFPDPAQRTLSTRQYLRELIRQADRDS